MNIDDVIVTPRWSRKYPGLLLCARCDEGVAAVVPSLTKEEPYQVMPEPSWAKVINTDGQVWRRSTRAVKKERYQRRTGTIGSPDVRAPAARRDHEIDALDWKHPEYRMICSCGLHQKIVMADVDPANQPKPQS
jgi:hypothetical protein